MTQMDANPLGPASPQLQVSPWAVQVSQNERGTDVKNCEAAPRTDWAKNSIDASPGLMNRVQLYDPEWTIQEEMEPVQQHEWKEMLGEYNYQCSQNRESDPPPDPLSRNPASIQESQSELGAVDEQLH